MQRALPNSSSDKCPLLFMAKTGFKRSRFFRFENLWLRFPQFQELVKTTWQATPTTTTPAQFQNKLNNLQQRIKEWTGAHIGTIKSQIETCKNFMTWIDKVKELRVATQLEKLIATVIKQRHTTLVVLEEDLWRQGARTKWDLHGDRSNKYFLNSKDQI